MPPACAQQMSNTSKFLGPSDSPLLTPVGRCWRAQQIGTRVRRARWVCRSVLGAPHHRRSVGRAQHSHLCWVLDAPSRSFSERRFHIGHAVLAETPGSWPSGRPWAGAGLRRQPGPAALRRRPADSRRVHDPQRAVHRRLHPGRQVHHRHPARVAAHRPVPGTAAADRDAGVDSASPSGVPTTATRRLYASPPRSTPRCSPCCERSSSEDSIYIAPRSFIVNRARVVYCIPDSVPYNQALVG